MNLAYSKNFQKLNLLSTKTRKKRKIITTAPRARRESDSVQTLLLNTAIEGESRWLFGLG